MSILETESEALQEDEGLRRQGTESWREQGEEALHGRTGWLPLIFPGVPDLLFLIGVEAGPQFRCLAVNPSHPKKTGSSLACPPLPPDHLGPGSLAPNIGDHGPSDSALAAARGWRLRRPAADRHAARCASRDLCSGARHSAPCALAGWTQEQSVGKLIVEALPPQQAQFMIGKYTEAMRRRGPTTYEESIDVPGGRSTVETTLTPIFDEQGYCLYLLGAARDIAERKRAEETARQAYTDLEQREQGSTVELQRVNEALRAEIEERKRIAAVLQAAEEDYRTLFENAVEGIYRSSLDGKQLRANPALVKLNGYSSEEEQIAGVNDIATEWYVDLRRREEFARLLEEQGTVTDFESEIYRHKTRERIWISETARLVRASDGTPLYYEGTVQDITTRKRAEEALHKAHAELEQRVREQTAELSHANALLQEEIEERRRIEEALRENEKRYRDLFENANDAIATFTLDGKITALNRAAERLIGWPREDLIGQDVHRVATPASVTLAEERAQRFLAGEKMSSPSFEAELLHRDGRVVWVEARTRAIRDAAGKPVGFQGIYRDITERKQTEGTLRENEQRYRAVVETQTELVCRFRSDTTLTFVNEAYCRYFGKSRKELLGTSFLSLVPEHARPAVKAHIDSLVAHPRLVVDEHEVIAAGGNLRWQRWTDQAVVDETGQPIEFQSTGLDITERKRAEEALQQLQVELAHVSRVLTVGEMAASIAHEVNQPLGAIVGNADICLRLLASKPPDLGQARDALSDIIKDGHRASDVIARIRTLVRKGALQKTSLNINEIIREATVLVGHEIQRNHIRLRTDFAADLPPTLGDRVQLGQVMQNLIMNGIEAMSQIKGRSRELVIRSDKDGEGGVLITVQDCGVGIDAQEAKRMFTAFYTTKLGGMGMGLAICRSIVEAHGGRLWVVPNVGPGATFQFTLPSSCEEER